MWPFGKKPTQDIPAPAAAPAGAAATLIGPGVRIAGRITGQGDVDLAGRLEGDCRIAGRLHVHPRAALQGEVEADRVRVGGHLEGGIEARQEVVVEPGGRVQACVTTPRLAMAAGAWLAGEVRMPASIAPAAGPPKGLRP
jgi:cytoskeletal protein CcmA (bactofilin family)